MIGKVSFYRELTNSYEFMSLSSIIDEFLLVIPSFSSTTVAILIISGWIYFEFSREIDPYLIVSGPAKPSLRLSIDVV